MGGGGNRKGIYITEHSQNDIPLWGEGTWNSLKKTITNKSRTMPLYADNDFFIYFSKQYM